MSAWKGSPTPGALLHELSLHAPPPPHGAPGHVWDAPGERFTLCHSHC